MILFFILMYLVTFTLLLLSLSKIKPLDIIFLWAINSLIFFVLCIAICLNYTDSWLIAILASIPISFVHKRVRIIIIMSIIAHFNKKM